MAISGLSITPGFVAGYGPPPTQKSVHDPPVCPDPVWKLVLEEIVHHGNVPNKTLMLLSFSHVGFSDVFIMHFGKISCVEEEWKRRNRGKAEYRIPFSSSSHCLSVPNGSLDLVKTLSFP